MINKELSYSSLSSLFLSFLIALSETRQKEFNTRANGYNKVKERKVRVNESYTAKRIQRDGEELSLARFPPEQKAVEGISQPPSNRAGKDSGGSSSQQGNTRIGGEHSLQTSNRA